jgi:hypothetical protein
MQKNILKLLVILAIFLTFLNFSGPAAAHPPLSMDLEYNGGILSVVIYHYVASPETTNHYIETVEIYLNDAFYHEETYTTQPAMATSFTYEYNVTAYPGDTIRVTATCSVGGNITETLVIPSGQLPMDVDVQTSSSDVEAGNDVAVTVKVDSQGTGVAEADITLSSDNGGTFSDVEDKGNGEYTSTFTAPALTSDTTVTITAKASKAGHTPSEDTVEITVTAPPASDDDDDDDNGLPGFEAIGLLVGVVTVALIMAFRKRNR